MDDMLMVQACQDRLDLMALVRAERDARDSGRWDEMATLYEDGATVRVSWFTGSATDFIEASRSRATASGRSIHQIGYPAVQVIGDRALVTTPCVLYIDRAVVGVPCEVVCLMDLRSRAVRTPEGWRLQTFVAIYKKDFLLPREPGSVPALDASELANYRASYRYLSVSRGANGRPPDQTLPGIDRPDLVAEMMAADQSWLQRPA